MPESARINTARRGLTLLEIVLAVTLLALMAGAASMAVSYVIAGQERQGSRLAAAEVANRLVLQYLDDEDSLPSQGSIVRYAADYYRWELAQEPLKLKAMKDLPTPAAGTPLRASNTDRLRQVTVRVWLSEESGGGREWGAGVPGTTVTRMVDPLAFRNPDSFGNMVNTDEGMRRLLEQMMGVAPPPPPRSR
ncbi:MAG: type II secretion system protein [Phycisphaerae bacterium]|nr:type II secretion system protein [Phycisphaerae bacterium]